MGARILAIAGALGSLGVAGAAYSALAEEHRPIAWLAFIIPGFSLVSFSNMRKEKRRWDTYGESLLELPQGAALIGGVLNGTVRFNKPVMATSGTFHVRLKCTAETGNGKNQQTRIVWQREHVIAATDDCSVPARFAIPEDCEPTTLGTSDRRIHWTLNVYAAALNVDFQAEFAVPVLEGELTPSQAALIGCVRAEEDQLLANYRPSGISGIQIRTAFSGADEFYFPALRNRGSTMVWLVIMLIWGGVTAWMLHVHTPIFTPCIFGGIGVLVLLFSALFYLQSSRAQVAPDQLIISKRLFGFESVTVLEGKNINVIRTSIGMTSGSTVYNDIKLELKNGKEITVARSIRDGIEAEWLAREMMLRLRPEEHATVGA